MEELHYAWFECLLGRRPHRPLPDIAADAVAAGVDSPALWEMAGEDRRQTLRSAELLALVAQELGIAGDPLACSKWERVKPLFRKTFVLQLEAALALVQADIDATLPHVGRLSFMPLGPNDVVIRLPSGKYDFAEGTISGLASGGPPLVAVAESTQNCLLAVEGTSWPMCPLHQRTLRLVGSVPNGSVR